MQGVRSRRELVRLAQVRMKRNIGETEAQGNNLFPEIRINEPSPIGDESGLETMELGKTDQLHDIPADGWFSAGKNDHFGAQTPGPFDPRLDFFRR